MNLYRTILSVVLFAICSLTTAQAQDSSPKNNKAANQAKAIKEQAGRPDIPGDLVIELGFNTLMDAPDNMKLNVWGSKVFNVHYLHGWAIGESAFSFHAGLGVGTDKYAFDEPRTLGYVTNTNGNRDLAMLPLDTLFEQASFNKSKLATTAIEVPLELRWISRKYDPKRSVKVIAGVKGGYLVDIHTKIKYDQYGQVKKTKQKEDFELNKLRYGVYGKVGYGAFGLSYYYQLSQLFDAERGPDGTAATPMTFGLWLYLF